jgi:hypothetical protein
METNGVTVMHENKFTCAKDHMEYNENGSSYSRFYTNCEDFTSFEYTVARNGNIITTTSEGGIGTVEIVTLTEDELVIKIDNEDGTFTNSTFTSNYDDAPVGEIDLDLIYNKWYLYSEKFNGQVWMVNNSGCAYYLVVEFLPNGIVEQTVLDECIDNVGTFNTTSFNYTLQSPQLIGNGVTYTIKKITAEELLLENTFEGTTTLSTYKRVP